MPEEPQDKDREQPAAKPFEEKNPNANVAEALRRSHPGPDRNPVKPVTISDVIDDDEENKPPVRTTDKELNFRNLRESKEAAEKKLQESQEELERLRAFNERLAPFDQELGEKHEGSFEKYQESLGAERKEREELQERLKQRDLEIEKISIESSDWYQNEVVRPVGSAKESYLALFGEGETLQLAAKELLSNIGNNTEALTFSDRAAITKFLGDHEELRSINPTYVMGAIEDLKSKMGHANEIISNRETVWKERQQEEERTNLMRAKEQIELNLHLHKKQAAEANTALRARLAEKSYGLFESEEFDDAEGRAIEYMTGLIDGTSQVDWGRANEMAVKAQLFDSLVESGRTGEILKAKQRDREGLEGNGDRPARQAGTSGESAIDELRRMRKSVDSPNRNVVAPIQ